MSLGCGRSQSSVEPGSFLFVRQQWCTLSHCATGNIFKQIFNFLGITYLITYCKYRSLVVSFFLTMCLPSPLRFLCWGPLTWWWRQHHVTFSLMLTPITLTPSRSTATMRHTCRQMIWGSTYGTWRSQTKALVSLYSRMVDDNLR